MKRFLAIGECMAELAPMGAPRQYQMGFAGDTFNTAWYLARLCGDADVAYFTALGDDAISSELLSFIKASGIDDRQILTVPNSTVGLYAIALNNGERSFTYWRGQSAAKQLAGDPVALKAAIAEADVVYFSGITLGILDAPGRNTLLEALDEARKSGKTVAFDPNLRPRLWSSSAQMCEQIMRGASVSNVALPSFEDESDWFLDASPQATAQRYLSAGAETVVVKNGDAPVYYHAGDGTGEVQVQPATNVVDTTAAGDSFNAGVLAGVLTGESLAPSIAVGCKLARQVVQNKGALIALDSETVAPSLSEAS